jgi:hypothetical protein
MSSSRRTSKPSSSVSDEKIVERFAKVNSQSEKITPEKRVIAGLRSSRRV